MKEANAYIKDVIIVAETEKAYGVISKDVISGRVNPSQVTSVKEVKEATYTDVQWLAKKMITDVKIEPCDIFPLMAQNYVSKYNKDIVVYKTSMSCSAPLFVLKDKAIPYTVNGEEHNNTANTDDMW